MRSIPDFDEAKLRLGWVLALDDSRDKAREQLEVVAAQATRKRSLNLAHMFLGSLHERAKRPADAAREYEGGARCVAVPVIAHCADANCGRRW